MVRRCLQNGIRRIGIIRGRLCEKGGAFCPERTEYLVGGDVVKAKSVLGPPAQVKCAKSLALPEAM